MTTSVSYTVWRCIRRLEVLNKHFAIGTKVCCSSAANNVAPSITVKPSVGMVDEKVNIHIRGLAARQVVTVVADVIENGMKFESRCIYQADNNGEIHNFSTESIGGYFKGVEPMGLFWSLKCLAAPNQSARLIKKDVSTPMKFNIKVYSDAHEVPIQSNDPITGTKVERLYKKPGVRRIPLTGKIKGTLFIPEGDGPFPALTDMYGGLVSLIETRAALLASHGYVTLALSYLYSEGLPNQIYEVNFSYITDAYEWLIEQDFVDKNRLGAVGLCFGGFLSLALTSIYPQIRAVVNINGITISPEHGNIVGHSDKWLDRTKVYTTEEGVVINDIYQCENPWPIPAWQHGAKILTIIGEDDKQVHPKWHSFFYEKCPPKFKENITMYRYPGAGHMIEPPFAPHPRAVTPGRKRMQSINFVPEKFHDEDMMSGGWPEQHAHAQEDSWEKMLSFLDENVKNISH
ncbi:bile acid-CoA:amino acid N-acyltransferase-like isoform X1 [Ruditapes philippinarum]|uniref:bile acid-CoA:amino acid N-acyltransferase-like isoform X1 n=1 Tax=Ruditapes philippinarum TaxID=129788 RepID=UPI00295C39B7|nr:bile acid-CoA:amino acid N-acyltransferase-like isoform X1 [Ruditapes philippinarum]